LPAGRRVLLPPRCPPRLLPSLPLEVCPDQAKTARAGATSPAKPARPPWGRHRSRGSGGMLAGRGRGGGGGGGPRGGGPGAWGGGGPGAVGAIEAGPPVAFGTLLRRYRVAAGWTQEELAARAGLSERNLGDLERGVGHTPRKDTVALLAGALDLAPGDRAAFA